MLRRTAQDLSEEQTERLLRAREQTAKMALALDQARVQAYAAQDRISPHVESAVDMAKERLFDAKDHVLPFVEEARDRIAPIVEDAKDKAQDVLPSKADVTAGAGKAAAKLSKDKASSDSGSGGVLKKLLFATGLGGLAFLVVRRLSGGSSEPQWQSTVPPRPTTVPTTTTARDVAGASPGEAASDSVETAHVPTTPDAPAETVKLED